MSRWVSAVGIGLHRQATEAAAEFARPRIVSSLDDVCGYEVDAQTRRVFVGAWWQLPDAMRIVQHLRMHGARGVRAEFQLG